MKIAELQDYIRVPNLSTQRTLQLARALRGTPPFAFNTLIEAASLELDDAIAETQTLLQARVRAAGPTLLEHEARFDRAVEALWVGLRKSLEVKEAYGHPGLAQLPEATQAALGLDRLREEARQAASIRAHLYGRHGNNFVLLPYVEQVGVMASILQLIANDELGPTLERLVGPDLPRLLSTCQIHYEASTSSRRGEQRRLLASLAEQRVALRWAIFRYNNAILTLVDPHYPETLANVAELLQPMIEAHGERSDSAGPSRPRQLEARKRRKAS